MEKKAEKKVVFKLDSPKDMEQAKVITETIRQLIRSLKKEGAVDDKTDLILTFKEDE